MQPQTIKRQHVQHVLAWSPYYKKDKELLEKNPTKIYGNDKRYAKEVI